MISLIDDVSIGTVCGDVTFGPSIGTAVSESWTTSIFDNDLAYHLISISDADIEEKSRKMKMGKIQVVTMIISHHFEDT